MDMANLAVAPILAPYLRLEPLANPEGVPGWFLLDEWRLRSVSLVPADIRCRRQDATVHFTGRYALLPFNRLINQTVRIVPAPDCSSDACLPVIELIYTEVANALHDNVAEQRRPVGHYVPPIDLGALFAAMKQGVLSDHVRSLAPIGPSPCPTLYELLRADDEVEPFGFATAKWELSPSLRAYLDLIVGAVRSYAQGHELKDAQIRVIGFADARDIRGRQAAPAKAHYRPESCPENTTSGDTSFVDLLSPEGSATRLSTIENNCQLSAARAHAAADFLWQRLGDIIEQSMYAAGGIKNATPGDIPENRAVAIELVLHAARTGESDRSSDSFTPVD